MNRRSNKGRPARKRSRLKRIGLVLLLSLLVLEGASRLVLGNLGEVELLEFWPEDGRSLGLRPGATSSYNGYFLKVPEVTLKVNEFGFRGAARPAAKQPSVYRIALFGDSYTFGVGVEEDETTAVHLESLLAASGRAAEVLNFGIPGANAEDLSTQYPLFISRWRPDLLILQVSPNDLGKPMFSKGDPIAPEIVTAVFREVYSARVLLVGAFLSGMAVTSIFGGDSQDHRDVASAKLEDFRRWIAEIRSSAAADGTPLAVVMLGNPVEGVSMRVVLSAAHGGHDATLDASSLLAEDRYRIPKEGHFNVRGNKRLARELFEFLREIVPSGKPADQEPLATRTR